MKTPRDKYVSLMTGGENVWDFVMANCDDEDIKTHLREMVQAALRYLKEHGMEHWSGGFQLLRVRQLSLEDGRTVDAYCFEYNVWPGFRPGMTEAQREEAVSQVTSFPCFLRLNENRKIVEYIEATRTN